MSLVSTTQITPHDLATLTPDQVSAQIAYAKGRPRRENGGIVICETPGLSLEEALNERAALHGMPPVGTTLTSDHGTEWEIVGYRFFATPTTFARYPNDCDYLPVLFPKNFSQRLGSFLSEVDRCTSKQILFLDIMPSAHPFKLGEDIHCANFNPNPNESVIYLDLKHAHETTIAHELGHLWLAYVGGDDDHRVLRDASNNGKKNQFDFIYSFVTDLKVNDLIAERGFDMSLINQDQINCLTLLRDMFIMGYRPPTPREALLHSLSIAGAILEQKRWPGVEKQRLRDLLGFFEAATPKIHQTAQELMQIVCQHGYGSREATRKVLDECISLGFRATGDDFDIERDLRDISITECMQDKYPDFLSGCPVPLKLEIGKTLARNAISGEIKVLLSMTSIGMAQIMVETENGEKIGPLTVNYQIVPFAYIANLDPMKLMRQQNGSETADEIYERVNGRKRPNPFGGVALVNGHVPDEFRRLPGHPLYNRATSPENDPLRDTYSSHMQVPVETFHQIQNQQQIDPFHPQFPHNGLTRRYMAGVGLAVAKARMAQMMAEKGVNPYQYGLNNPVNFVDPGGDTAISAIKFPPFCINIPCLGRAWWACFSYCAGQSTLLSSCAMVDCEDWIGYRCYEPPTCECLCLDVFTCKLGPA